MGCTDEPKVMLKVAGKPIIEYLLDEFSKVPDCELVVVVGFQGQKVVDFIDERAKIVWQKEQLGTADAVAASEDLLKDEAEKIIIVYGDHPLMKAQTIERLLEISEQKQALTMAYYVGKNHSDYGRVITDTEGHVEAIVEAKNATPEQLNINQKNVGMYVVEGKWLWPTLKKIKKNSVSGEYYLTDIIELAIDEGKKVVGIELTDPEEALGINTPEQLETVEQAIAKYSK